MSGRTQFRDRIGVLLTANMTGKVVPFGWPHKLQRCLTGSTKAWILAVFYLSKSFAGRTYENVCGVSSVFSQQVSGEKINLLAAMTTGLHFDPKEIFDLSVFRSAFNTVCAVEMSNFIAQIED